MTIDEYLARVGTALTNPSARAGLDDLRTALEERAAAVGEGHLQTDIRDSLRKIRETLRASDFSPSGLCRPPKPAPRAPILLGWPTHGVEARTGTT